jgi:hypothetical protein
VSATRSFYSGFPLLLISPCLEASPHTAPQAGTQCGQTTQKYGKNLFISPLLLYNNTRHAANQEIIVNFLLFFIKEMLQGAKKAKNVAFLQPNTAFDASFHA